MTGETREKTRRHIKDEILHLNKELCTELGKLAKLDGTRPILIDLLDQDGQLVSCWAEPHRPEQVFQ